MKFFRKISIFLLSAAIFMSALVVFAGNAEELSTDSPYLRFTINISEKNRIKDTDRASLETKISDAVSAPFFALTRDYPDLTMWTTGFSLRSSCSEITSGTKKTFILTSVEYTLNGNPKYGDPSGMLKQLQDIVDAFTPTGDTMYDKLKSIHDYICKTNTYVSNALYCYSAYGSLVDHKSVCEGYAEAFKLLCDKVGIDCILVTGMSLPNTDNDNTEAHMWNLVRMDDDAWYAVDVTWDDAGDVEGNYNYFLVGTDTVVRGRKFSESHHVSYDFITIGGNSKTISALQYPVLSSSSYDKDNGRTEYVHGAGRYHYGFLDDVQKELYDKMLNELIDKMPSDPSKTPNVETTDNNVTTTPDESTTPDEITTPEESTTPKESTTPEITTTPDQTTTPEETTTPEITTESPKDTTTEPNTETDPDNTTPGSTTNPPATSTQKDTDPPASSTTEKPDTTATDTVDNTSKKPDNTSGVTTAGQDGNRQDSEVQKLYKTVATIVIVSAITCLSAALVFFIIRYAKKHK